MKKLLVSSFTLALFTIAFSLTPQAGVPSVAAPGPGRSVSLEYDFVQHCLPSCMRTIHLRLKHTRNFTLKFRAPQTPESREKPLKSYLDSCDTILRTPLKSCIRSKPVVTAIDLNYIHPAQSARLHPEF